MCSFLPHAVTHAGASTRAQRMRQPVDRRCDLHACTKLSMNASSKLRGRAGICMCSSYLRSFERAYTTCFGPERSAKL
eukprot:1039387-Pleurochrysis_carterae.AAC.4